ncbi:MAG: signal peptidase II [Oceanicaulis sp.]
MRPMFARRRKIPPLAVFGFAIALAVLIADQASKFWILEGLDLDAGGPGSRVNVLDPWFNLTMVWNRGVSFGMFQADSWWQRGLLITISLAVSGFLAYWLFSAERRMQAAAFGLIIGGAVGNVIDRFLYGAVVDFFDFSGLWFPYVFNVADAAISIGVAVLILDLVLHGEGKR